jgi:signal recognition particle subunit SRP54
MFNNLTNRLSNSFKALQGKNKLSESNIKDAIRQVRRALLEADVALEVIKVFLDKVQEKALGLKVGEGLNPSQAFIKLVESELTQIIGGENKTLDLKAQPPAVVMVAGLQGAGKTTSIAKLARYLKERENKKVLVVSADVYRPAAIKQLAVLAQQVGVDFFPSNINEKPVSIVAKAKKHAQKQFFDVLLVDTAGRLHVDSEMMDEIQVLQKKVNPIETLFVVDINDKTSPMPNRRETILSGWNGSSASTFSPTPKNLIGLPVIWRTESAAPPRASPSVLVKIIPVNGKASAKTLAVCAAS